MNKELITILSSFKKWAETSQGGCSLTKFSSNTFPYCEGIQCDNCIIFHRDTAHFYQQLILSVRL